MAVQLVGNRVNSTVNNPIARPWPIGAAASWYVVRVRHPAHAVQGKGHGQDKQREHSHLQEAGVKVDYLMLRGIFMPGGVSQDKVNYYINLFKKVREPLEWKEFMEKGAFNQSFMSGKEYASWVQQAEDTHKALMQDAGFLASNAHGPLSGGPRMAYQATRWNGVRIDRSSTCFFASRLRCAADATEE